nr:reverse transcriptase domain-containing protein [Tanacetum cinerariifolium]
MADQRTMAQLLQAPIEGYEDAIVVPIITADNFELKHSLLTLVQNKQFFGHDKEDPHAHVRYFNKITSTLKFPNVPNTSIKLMLFPFSLEGAARIWLEKEPPRSIFTWDDLVSKFINQFFHPSKTTNLRNEITNFQQRFDESFSEAWGRFKDLLRACPHHGFSELHQLDMFYNALNSKDQDSLNSAVGGNFLDKIPRECLAIIESKSKVRYSCNKPVVAKVSMNTSTFGISPDVAELKDMVKALLFEKKSQNQSPAPVKAVKESCVTCSGAHSYRNSPVTDGNVYHNIQEFVSQASAVNYNQGNTSYRHPTIAFTSSSGTLPRNTIANPRGDLNAITTRSGVSYDVPQFLPLTSFLPKVVQSESLILKSEPVTSPISEPAIAPVSASKPNPKSSIPYPSRRNDERNCKKANNQIEKFYQIFKDMSFKISFADALILMPKFASTLKALIGNKEKLSKMAQTPLNEQCYAVLLKKLPEKLGDPGKFLIPCDFLGMAECLALADLGARINLISFFVWKRLSLPDLTLTYMTLELADRSISRPVGVAKYVYVKVGSFYFPADFVVVDFDADPRVPLFLGRSFLKTERAIIDVFEGELTLRVGNEAITFNLDQTSRYSANYSDMTTKRIDVIDMACEEYSQEVLGFSDTISNGNPTPFYDPIVSTTSPTLTPFRNSDFLLEKVDAFLAIKDEPTSFEVYQPYLDREGDILLLEAFLNDDPSLPPPNQRKYLLEVRKELKICEAKSYKSSVDKPPLVKLKDLSPHLEYALLEGDDKLPVIIAKDLSVEEKTALITEKSLVKEGIVLGHKISKQGIKVDKAKVDVITKLPHPTTVKEKDTPFIFSQECVEAFQTLKRKLTEAPILIALDWDMPFELMCDASDFAIGEVLGQCQDKHFRPIHYASKTMTEAESNYTTTEKEILSVVKIQRRDCSDKFYFSKNSPSSGQVEVSNRGLKRILERAVGENCESWSDKLDDALWAFRTAYKTLIGCTSYKLVYGKACHLPVELEHKAYWALKNTNFDMKTAGDHRKIQINELNKLRDQAYKNSLIYKEKIKRFHDSKIKNRVFNIGDRVLLFNSRMKIFFGKLKSRWSGQFKISQVYPYGNVELS